MVYLGQFGKQINEAQLFDIMLLAEHYLMKVLKQGTSCTNMDDPVFLPGLKGGKVLIWEKGTFVRGLSF